jgi:hypothetical protein
MRRRGGIVAVAAVALGVLLLPTGVANAAPVDDDVDALMEVVETTEADVTAVDEGESLNVDEAAGAIEVVLADDAGASVFVEPEPELERGAGPTIYSVIETHTEAAQSFDFVVDGEAAVLAAVSMGESEFIEISSAVTGEVVNIVLPAWAEDARGRDVATEYVVEGGTLTQVVETRGAAFPIVADPALACNWTHCTVQSNKWETRQIAAWGSSGAIIFGAMCAMGAGIIGGGLCGAYGAWHVNTAIQAQRYGRCYGQQFVIYASGLVYPVQYSGGNCR